MIDGETILANMKIFILIIVELLTDKFVMGTTHYFQIKKFFLLVLIFIFTVPTQAQKKNTFKFLSHEQFQKLTEPEKKSYLKQIRNLLEEMTENAKVSVFEYLFMQKAFAQNERAEFNTPSKYTPLELDRLDSLMRAARMYKKGATDNSAPTALQISKENSVRFVQRMNEVSKRLNTETDRRLYNRLKTEFANDFPVESQQITAFTTSQSTTSSSPEIMRSQNPARAVVTQSAQTQKDVKSQPQPTTKAVIALKTSAATTPSPICIYAGFVIYGDKCSPNKTLPTDFVLSEIRSEIFKCESESEILCNPLMFGFKKNCLKLEPNEVCSEKPICISRSVNATKNCLKISDSTEQLNQVLELWKNPKNKAVYEKFTKDLNQLCNADNIVSKDIKQTCQVAARRFNKIIEKNDPAGKAELKIKTAADPVKTDK